MEPTPETIAALKIALAKKTTYYPESKIPDYAIHDENNICGFFGPFRFLSNFPKCPKGIEYLGTKFSSVENAFQAAKFSIKWPK